MRSQTVSAIVRIVSRLPFGAARDRARAILFAGAGRPFGLTHDDVHAILAIALDVSRTVVA
jgi:hypothetical protein